MLWPFSQFIELHPAARLLSLFILCVLFTLNFIPGHNNYFYMKSKFQRHLPDIRQTLMVIGSCVSCRAPPTAFDALSKQFKCIRVGR